MQLSEDILHFVWRHGLFDSQDLKTSDGNPIQLLNRGIHNHHSGPDFMEAKIKLGETLWAGQVEIHLRSSDWYQHQHEKDRTYDNVILHVVYFNDKDVYINGQKLPVLEMNGRIPPSLFNRYKELLQKKNEIACSNSIHELNRATIVSQMERSLVDRLERKADRILNILESQKNDWEETAFRIICLQMAGKINEQPMEWLLNEIKLKNIRSLGRDKMKKEALLFGVAGMLNECNDDYSKKMVSEYAHLKNKFRLVDLDPKVWRYGRMRPAQFPNLKISQIIDLVDKNEFLFERLLKLDVDFIHKRFLDLEASEYWTNHHQFGKETKNRSVKLGKMQKDGILINVVAPLLFAYGKYHSDEKWKEKATDLLMKIKGEENHIVRKWEATGIKMESAFDSQGLIELYNNSCIQKKCLTCIIGTNLLR